MSFPFLLVGPDGAVVRQVAAESLSDARAILRPPPDSYVTSQASHALALPKALPPTRCVGCGIRPRLAPYKLCLGCRNRHRKAIQDESHARHPVTGATREKIRQANIRRGLERARATRRAA